jgi:hypothetical protein
MKVGCSGLQYAKQILFRARGERPSGTQWLMTKRRYHTEQERPLVSSVSCANYTSNTVFLPLPNTHFPLFFVDFHDVISYVTRVRKRWAREVGMYVCTPTSN